MATTLEEFLTEHNRLSPTDLQATKEMLVRFQDEKSTLLRDGDWSLEKVRRPFVAWLCATLKRKDARRSTKTGWVTFPRSID